MVFSQTMDSISNRPFPKIEVSAYSQIRYNMSKRTNSVVRTGASFGNRIYSDSLVNHLDTIIQTRELSMKDLPFYSKNGRSSPMTFETLLPIFQTI